MNARLMRMKGLVVKEFLQIWRDASSLAIAFALPVFLLLLFGYGVSLDAKDVPVGWVIEHNTPETNGFTASFQRSGYFFSRFYPDFASATRALQAKQINAIIRLREDFSRKLSQQREPADVQVIVDGVDANNARLISGYVQGAWSNWLAHHARQRGAAPMQPVLAEPRIWYNSAVLSKHFLVPGLIALIMTLIGAMLTAMVMAREWERGTLEAMIASPVTMSEVLLGKLIPYYLMGMGGLLLSIAMAVFLFGVPLRGSFWVLLVTGSLFLLVALGMGLTISIIAKNQFVAAQMALIATYLPAFILSGFIFDINSMPVVIQGITHLVAARYFVSILQTLFLAGDIWAVILPNSAGLLLMALFFFAVVFLKAPKRLE